MRLNSNATPFFAEDILQAVSLSLNSERSRVPELNTVCRCGSLVSAP